VPVDQNFFDRYFTLDVPYMKAGDLLFLFLVRGEAIPLVTEDDALRQKERDAGVETYAVEGPCQLIARSYDQETRTDMTTSGRKP
jgi:hypothetical protein